MQGVLHYAAGHGRLLRLAGEEQRQARLKRFGLGRTSLPRLTEKEAKMEIVGKIFEAFVSVGVILWFAVTLFLAYNGVKYIFKKWMDRFHGELHKEDEKDEK